MPFDPLHQIDSVAFHPDSAKVALTKYRARNRHKSKSVPPGSDS